MTQDKNNERDSASYLLTCVLHLEQAIDALEDAVKDASKADELEGTSTAEQCKLALSFAKTAKNAIVATYNGLSIVE